MRRVSPCGFRYDYRSEYCFLWGRGIGGFFLCGFLLRFGCCLSCAGYFRPWLRECLRKYAGCVMDFKSDFAVRWYIEMEVEKFNLFDAVRKFDILVPFYFLALYHEAYRNRVPQFCCDSTCLHLQLTSWRTVRLQS